MSERCKVCDRAGCPAVTNDPEPEHTDAPKWECPRCVAITDCAAHAVDWRARALAAEQRAEAAEAERDRMRAALSALPRYMLYLTGHSGSALVTHAVNPNGSWVKVEDVMAIDAYRAGQPATSEAVALTFVRMADGSGYNIIDDGAGIATTKSKVQAARIVAALGAALGRKRSRST